MCTLCFIGKPGLFTKYLPNFVWSVFVEFAAAAADCDVVIDDFAAAAAALPPAFVDNIVAVAYCDWTCGVAAAVVVLGLLKNHKYH